VVLGLVWVRQPDDPPYKAIATCTQPLGATPPEVDEHPVESPVALELVAQLGQGTAMTTWTDAKQLLVAQRTGQVSLLDPETGSSELLLDWSDDLVLGEEGGLIGMALDPDGQHLYLHRTDADGTSEIVELGIDGDELDESTERVVLRQPHPGGLHNGGAMAFGPDETLYIGFGDGGGRPSDADRVASLEHWDGKILRIDPHERGDDPYTVPEDNPFAGQADARPEIYFRGLRNPYQLTIDGATSTMWIGDVGELCFEEVDAVPLADAGADLGFPRFEAFHDFLGGEVGDARFPVYMVAHDDGFCALIAGLVSRDPALPELDEAFLVADLCSGTVQALRPDGKTVEVLDLGVKAEGAQAFGVDADGRAYVLTTAGVFRLVPADDA